MHMHVASPLTSLNSRCCRKILRTRTRDFIGGKVSIRSLTNPAATGPLATSKLMSKLMLLLISMNLMMGTLAFATTYMTHRVLPGVRLKKKNDQRPVRARTACPVHHWSIGV